MEREQLNPEILNWGHFAPEETFGNIWKPFWLLTSIGYYQQKWEKASVMLLHILQCIGWLQTTEKDLVQVVNSARIEKPFLNLS